MTLSGGDQDLEFQRRKPRTLLAAGTYRLAGVLRQIIGRERMLRFTADEAWILRRIAFELAGEVYGEPFHQHAMALSEDVLMRWLPAGGSVLDLGCGTGRWSRASAPHAGRVVGIDTNRDLIERARALTTGDRVSYVVGDITMPLHEQVGGERFDVALLIHVLEHIGDVDGLLTALHDVTATILVEVPDAESDPVNTARRWMGAAFYSDEDHVREYTRAMLEDHLARNSWRIQHREHRGGAIVAVATSA